jgi:N-methylhydantoinase A/oxoprolinase/acetone carboxylase beta subunit
MTFVIAVDSGGTFTDCVAVEDGGAITRAKSPSTPPDFERGVLNAVAEVAGRLGRSSSPTGRPSPRTSLSPAPARARRS